MASDSSYLMASTVTPSKPAVKPAAHGKAWLNKAMPLYTNYPSSGAFQEGLTGHDFAVALRHLPANEAVALYLYIPFCRSICLCRTSPVSVTHRQERIKNYLAALRREIGFVAGLWNKPRAVRHLFVSGGTPNLLSERQIENLFDELRDRFDFAPCEDITMEIDPHYVTEPQIRTLAACGVTSVKLGVQDFNPEVQRAVCCEQPFATVEAICGDLRAAGIESLYLDLMAGLPLQTPESVAASAQQAVRLSPDRVAVYSYAPSPHARKQQRAMEVLGLPDVYASLAIEQTARQVFVDAGYDEIGVDHFAKPSDRLAQARRDKRLRRDTRGYTDDRSGALVGLGASSISRLHDGFYQNEIDEAAYRALLNKNSLATTRGLQIGKEDFVRGAIIDELMCFMQCDVAAVCERYQFPFAGLEAEMKALKPLEAEGLVRRDAAVVKLVSPYRKAISLACQIFDRYTDSAIEESQAA